MVGIAPDERFTHAIYEHFADVWQAVQRHANLVLVDVPVGLPEYGERACDAAARASLKARRASIFMAPTRAAVYADAYAAAGEINRAHGGKGISKQTWNITGKIREVDTLMRTTPRARELIRESHPEIAFAALLGREMAHSKKTSNGIAARLELLQTLYSPASTLYQEALDQYRRRALTPDDILDALVLAITARLPNLETLPSNPPHDAHGLPMEIVLAGAAASLA